MLNLVTAFFWQAIDCLQTYNGAVTAFATFWIAVFTVVLAFVTRRQAILTRKGIELANAEFIATHRPKIIVRFIQGAFYEGIDEHQFVWITIANIGETRAVIEAIGGDLARRIGNEWLPPGLDAYAKPIAPITLESGQRHVFKVQARTPTTDATIFQEATQNVELCAVGVIQYRDGNGRLLETAFLRIDSGPEGFVPSKNPEDEYQD